MDAILGNFPGIIIILFALVAFLRSSIKIVPEYERGVIFRLGRVIGAKGPGLFFIVPFIDKMIKVDTRTVTLDVPTQEAITRDNVTVKVNAVCYFRVLEPTDAVINIENYLLATQQIAQTTLRSVLGQSELDELLSERDEINLQLQKIIDEQTEPWGIKVSVVEVKDVELPQSMQRAMARQAEAEREKRAKIIHADGEFQASKQLAKAAQAMTGSPGALQLRYLQTLNEISAENNSTIIFPLPIELLNGIVNFMGNGNAPSPSGSAAIPDLPVISHSADSDATSSVTSDNLGIDSDEELGA